MAGGNVLQLQTRQPLTFADVPREQPEAAVFYR